MNQERFNHSSCHFNGTLYVFCGSFKINADINRSITKREKATNIIEKLANADKGRLRMMQRWHTIDLGWEFVDRILPAVCPINNYELIILGGSHVRKETQMSSVWLFDTISETG